MPKYLAHASYTTDGLKGLLKDGGSKRREAVEQLAKGVGGTVEAFYYAFGDDDLFVIMDLPDYVFGGQRKWCCQCKGDRSYNTGRGRPGN